MKQALAEYPIPETIEDGFVNVEKLIYYQTHKFAKKYGEDFNELVGVAYEIFCKAHYQYVTGHTITGMPVHRPYENQISLSIWYGLLDSIKGKLRRNKKTKMIPLGDHDVPCSSPDFDATDFVACLNQDAQTVASLVLHPPEIVEQAISTKGGCPRNYRSTVRNYLLRMGWTRKRINDAFDEVRNALG